MPIWLFILVAIAFASCRPAYVVERERGLEVPLAIAAEWWVGNGHDISVGESWDVEVAFDPSLVQACGQGRPDDAARGAGRIWYGPGMVTGNCDKALVLAHEMGHVLGLGHSEQCPSVMSPNGICMGWHP